MPKQFINNNNVQQGTEVKADDFDKEKEVAAKEQNKIAANTPVPPNDEVLKEQKESD